MRRPSGHTLYWVYAWDEREGSYDFETTTSFSIAEKIARKMGTEGWHHGYIWWGDADGAFTQYDPAKNWRAWK